VETEIALQLTCDALPGRTVLRTRDRQQSCNSSICVRLSFSTLDNSAKYPESA